MGSLGGDDAHMCARARRTRQPTQRMLESREQVDLRFNERVGGDLTTASDERGGCNKRAHRDLEQQQQPWRQNDTVWAKEPESPWWPAKLWGNKDHTWLEPGDCASTEPNYCAEYLGVGDDEAAEYCMLPASKLRRYSDFADLKSAPFTGVTDCAPPLSAEMQGQFERGCEEADQRVRQEQMALSRQQQQRRMRQATLDNFLPRHASRARALEEAAAAVSLGPASFASSTTNGRVVAHRWRKHREAAGRRVGQLLYTRSYTNDARIVENCLDQLIYKLQVQAALESMATSNVTLATIESPQSSSPSWATQALPTTVAGHRYSFGKCHEPSVWMIASDARSGGLTTGHDGGA
jgi:hypothetical protein